MKYKIICICQVYNELEKGNLERFFKYSKSIVDGIVIYDDGSTDASYEYSLTQTPYVIRGGNNNFRDEVRHRQIMLEKALELSPDFILWLDADEVLSAQAAKELQNVCRDCIKGNFDGVALKELNLWRSHTWRRLDSLYDLGWFNRLWKVIPGMSFGEIKPGLHQDLFPSTVKNVMRTDKISVIHYGFSDEINLSYKYLTYRSNGQKGYNMLDRLISEEKLVVEKIPKNFFPNGLWIEDEKRPESLTFSESLSYVDRLSEQVLRPKYSIVCLIYKSVDWLKFVYEQVLKYTDLTDKEFFFVANDATEEVLEYLRDNYIPHYILNNTPEQQSEWYINNVYRGYNFSAKMARGDFVVFINSDMAFSPNWLTNLINSYDGANCVASRLVESGKLEVGKNGIEKNFGHIISEYKEDDFQRYAQVVSSDETIDSGLYMPLLVKRNAFMQIGGYPEGNIKTTSSSIFSPDIAKQGDELISGDRILIEKLESIGVHHQTSYSSIVYHFQCGEKDEQSIAEGTPEKIEVAICNDLVTGTMGEKVLWDYLIEYLPGAYGVDIRKVGEEDYSERARNYIGREHPETKIIIQNASFIDSIDKNIYTIAFLQDDLRSMGRLSRQQEVNLKLANKIVTNSYQTAAVYRDYPCEVIPVGLDSDLFKPQDKSMLRKKHGLSERKTGIFVGDFSEVKGWSKVKNCIEKFSDVQWILVTKKNEDYEHANARVYKRIDQHLLSELLNCADFFIIGSPVETQCLAAIEACLCGVPVVMRDVGLFRDLNLKEKESVGIIGEDLEYSVTNITKGKYCPREIMLSRGLTIRDSMSKWKHLVEQSILEININKNLAIDKNKSFSSCYFKLELFYRKIFLKKIVGNEDFQITKYFSKKHLSKLAGNVLRKIGLFNVAKKILRFVSRK